MKFYAGGTRDNFYAEGYSFLYNYLSDLGRVRTYLLESNHVSRYLFGASLIVVGVALTIFYIFIIEYFWEKKSTKWISIIASIIGIFSANVVTWIGIIPYDLQTDTHHILVYLSMGCSLLPLILYSAAIFITRKLSRFYAWIFIFTSIVPITYLLLIYTGLYRYFMQKTTLQGAGQKIIIYAMTLCVFIISIGCLRSSYKLEKKDELLTSTD